MTKYKQNLLSLKNNIRQLKQFKTFEDYLAMDMFDDFDQAQNFGLSHRQLKLTGVEVEPQRHLQTMIQPEDTPLVQVNKTVKRKTIQASIWASDEHPLSIGTFLPLLNVLSFSSKQVRKLSKYLTQYQLPQETFPISARVPLFMTMEATFNFKNLKFSAP